MYSNYDNWTTIGETIPYLHFENDWNVKIIPPFGGATTRFVVSKGDKYVSVYLDCYAALGLVYDEEGNPSPYYEIYPSQDGDTKRYLLNEVDKMMNDIKEILG